MGLGIIETRLLGIIFRDCSATIFECLKVFRLRELFRHGPG